MPQALGKGLVWGLGGWHSQSLECETVFIAALNRGTGQGSTPAEPDILCRTAHAEERLLCTRATPSSNTQEQLLLPHPSSPRPSQHLSVLSPWPGTSPRLPPLTPAVPPCGNLPAEDLLQEQTHVDFLPVHLSLGVRALGEGS